MKGIKDFYKGKRVLVTGHTGFKGAWLARILLNCGAKVSGVALKPETRPNLFGLLRLKYKLSNHFADVRNFKKLKEIILKEKPEIVFHLAAQPLVRRSYDDPLYTLETNIMGTANLLQAIKEYGRVRSAVIITTDKVYKNKRLSRAFKEEDELGGRDPYSASKVAAEIVIDSHSRSFFGVQDYGVSHKTLVASARAGNVIGGGDWSEDRLLPDIVKSIFEHDGKVIIRNPGHVRAWQHVLEPLRGYLLLARELYQGKKRFSGGWNFGPNAENFLSVEELLEKTFGILGRGSYSVKKDAGKFEEHVLRLNSDKARKLLNWRASFDIDKALRMTLDWYRGFYNGEDVIHITDQQINSFFS
ncbi:MAG: CDP-glucose 4,6-dehydratase [Candidatus Liptonbacteria bacterium]|nr:CDP-glucose 4,6-dehydratase [Candidatus Liptonbacteria bacterium]